jgi:iron complex outermembrane receptor protein
VENGTQGDSHGIEFSGTFRPWPSWRLRSGYTYFDKDLEGKPGHDLAASNYDPETLGYDAKNNILVQSIVDLPLGLQFDITAHYLTDLGTQVPDYFSFDARVAWVYKKWEVAIAGQNLWEERHKEFVQEIPRSAYGKITCRL